MADDLMSGTAAGLFEFLDLMVERGWVPPTGADPMRSAARQVLTTVHGRKGYGSVDLRSLDLDEYLDRFQALRGTNGSAGTLKAYRQRFDRAVESYRAFLEDPESRPAIAARHGRYAAATNTAPRDDAGLITYPFPLRSGEIGRLQLPTTLERGDAERLAQFVMALTFDQSSQEGAGEE